MSRKARIEDKDDWASVRMFGANLHYSTIKPNAGAFDGATVILSDGVEGDGLGGAAHALTRHAPAVRQLLFGAVAGPFLDEPVSAAPVVVLDVSPLRLECEKQGVAWATWLAGEGAARDQLDKAVGKPVARAFNKLMLESNGATLVARGGLCQLALKLLRRNDSHAVAAADKLARRGAPRPDPAHGHGKRAADRRQHRRVQPRERRGGLRRRRRARPPPPRAARRVAARLCCAPAPAHGDRRRGCSGCRSKMWKRRR